MSVLIAVALFAAEPSAAPNSNSAGIETKADPDQAPVNHAADLIGAAKPAEAVAVLDTVIADQERRRQGDARQVFCARGPAEAAVYKRTVAKDQRKTVVLSENACYSIFLKGFALIDLNRSDEAKTWIERAVQMAPSNSHFLGELGEWYKGRKDWAQSRTLFQRAIDASALSPADRQIFDRTRGMRGLAFILIEDRKLDEAEKLYRECLKLDPNDDRSKKQLDYIASERSKQPGN